MNYLVCPVSGSRGTLCGYQIRFEARRCETTRLLYCTTGVLLRRLQVDPMLDNITHVIVDEVSYHVGAVDTDNGVMNFVWH